MNFDVCQQRRLGAVFDGFTRSNVEYAVLRGHESLPESTLGSDVDVLVAPADFERALDVPRRADFDTADSTAGNVAAIAREALERPRRTVQLLAADTRGTLAAVARTASPTRPTAHGYRERSFAAHGVAIHLVNHLAYASPMNGQPVRVDPSVERQLLEHRRERDGLSVPAPTDELLHLVCRGIYDYEGTFPAYYVERCETLAEAVLSGTSAEERFDELLSVVFYRAATVVRECVETGDYDEMRPRLFRFSDY